MTDATMKMNATGDKVWRNTAGEIHRPDGPAVEYLDGGKEWWRDGKHHRDNGPAVMYANGTKEWWVNGKRHRDDGPAIDHANGTKRWYQDGVLHRENAPAVENADGEKRWLSHSRLHRKDGPAIEYADGTTEWHLNGKPWPEGEEICRQRVADAAAAQHKKRIDIAVKVFTDGIQTPVLPTKPLQFKPRFKVRP